MLSRIRTWASGCLLESEPGYQDAQQNQYRGDIRVRTRVLVWSAESEHGYQSQNMVIRLVNRVRRTWKTDDQLFLQNKGITPLPIRRQILHFCSLTQNISTATNCFFSLTWNGASGRSVRWRALRMSRTRSEFPISCKKRIKSSANSNFFEAIFFCPRSRINFRLSLILSRSYKFLFLYNLSHFFWPKIMLNFFKIGVSSFVFMMKNLRICDSRSGTPKHFLWICDLQTGTPLWHALEICGFVIAE
jgi:hypothetical protein